MAVIDPDDVDALIAEGEAEPTDGWDFSWFTGRATEERPPWGYVRLAADRIGRADSVLDVQTGGAEVFAEALGAASRVPSRVAATEEWPPNFALASSRLAPFGGAVTELVATDPLPYDDGCFELVLARHLYGTPWRQIARVLAPGGVFLSQQIGRGTNRGLYEFFLGPQPDDDARHEHDLREQLVAAGLEPLQLAEARTRVEFFDVGAVVYFLRKVLWTVPGFTVAAHRERLRELHELIRRDGSFVCFSRRFLVEARKA